MTRNKVFEALMEKYKPPMPKSVHNVEAKLCVLTAKTYSMLSEIEKEICKEVFAELKKGGIE